MQEIVIIHMTDIVKGKNNDFKKSGFSEIAGKKNNFCWRKQKLSNCRIYHSNSSKERREQLISAKAGNRR